MKKILLVAAICLTSFIQGQSTWNVDNAHSSINFSVSHFLISEVTGSFTNFQIEAKADGAFESPVFTVSIDTGSINTNQEDRDDHLKSPDFFDIDNNPKITFKSTSYKQLENNKFETTGNITINGITKEVTFYGKLNGIIKDERSGKRKAGLKLMTTIEREVFNLGKGMSPIGKEVEVVIHIEMNEQ